MGTGYQRVFEWRGIRDLNGDGALDLVVNNVNDEAFATEHARTSRRTIIGSLKLVGEGRTVCDRCEGLIMEWNITAIQEIAVTRLSIEAGLHITFASVRMVTSIQ